MSSGSESRVPLDGAPLTFAYKHVDGDQLLLDVYLPTSASVAGPRTDLPSVPTVIYFHGGGLTVGNRQSWFPGWFQGRLSSLGYIFISADYRLVPPSTGHDVLEDVEDVFRFASRKLNPALDALYSSQPVGSPPGNAHENDGSSLGMCCKCYVDPNAIAVSGTSAGGLCAYLAAAHVTPKPRAVLSLYGMGGDFLTPHYLSPKTKPFLRGREILDPAAFSEFLYPFKELRTTSNSALAYHPPSHPIPGYPANPRMLLGRLYLQLGVMLDYYTGKHEPSLSTALRNVPASSDTGQFDTAAARHLIHDEDIRLFPQFNVTSDWPPTILVHGTSDTAVLFHDSQNMQTLLERAGVEVVMLTVDGKEHSFDYAPDAETSYKSEFDTVVEFLARHLQQDLK
ncbi:alpha/beta-hydrolase [Leucogyrophana mollusca]|uniref:Alpha/beta-hydrolase n=1 Tax=Leucogyrophana mollusca TaxID=85980 RepID=A0ACB8BL70_9AGAM|nr:alpha/beta-hydrolase [Leucogyrophana mollusca]